MNSKSILFLILIISSFDMFSQKEIFMDENMKLIDSKNYVDKCHAQIFKCYTYKTDSLKINKVLNKFDFGQITTLEANQIRLLFSNRSNSEIDSSSVLVISYKDTLYGYEHRLNNYLKHKSELKRQNIIRDSLKTEGPKIVHKHAPYSRKEFNKSSKSVTKKMNKCVKKTEDKFNSRVFYAYKYDKGFLKDFSKHWIKDNGVIKNSFFKIMYESHLVILKPNGEYFLGGSHLSDQNFKRLLKKEDWSKFKADWLKSKNSISLFGYGIFERPKGGHINHCF